MKSLSLDRNAIREFLTQPRDWRALLVSASRDSGATIALLVLIIYDIFFTPSQLNSTIAIANLLVHVAPTLIIAVGMTLVIATGGIDISVGAILAFTDEVAYLIFSGKFLGIHNMVVGTLVAIPVALVLGILMGSLNGVMVTRFNMQPIVATLITLITLRGVAEVLVDGFQFAFLSAPIVSWLGSDLFGFLPRQVLIMVVVVIVVAWIMGATMFGRHVLAVGGNRSAARLAGLPVNRVLITVYAISGFLAALAGLVNMAFVSAANPVTDGNGWELSAIAAVAIGGTPLTGGRATIVGTVIGAIFIQLLTQTLEAKNVHSDFISILVGALIILAVFIQRWRTA